MYPEANQNIDIKVTGLNQICKVNVAEVRDKEISIQIPMDQHVADSLQKGKIVDVSFVVDEKRYQFTTEIVDRKISLFIVKKPAEKDISSMQLRKNFRAPINIPLFLNEKKAITINISTGGISCLCRLDLRLKKGDVVTGTISLPSFSSIDKNTIYFKGEIIRVNYINELERNNVALKFIEMAQQDKIKIKHYCYDKQQKIKNSEIYISTTGFRTF
ncbi:MAG: hypothetical protein K0R71_1481 [Bacillales bacterium]|jgi:c-di-GMP-binding flagellar brake protein YcgR|nr:hypothetical protein [Bacillales bacterium]